MRQSTYIRRVTKQSALSFGVSLVATVVFAGSAQASDPIYQVDLNKTQILRLPAAAGSVIIGNPNIADVTVHSPMTVMIVGRGFGETNLIILDRNGQTMMDADIQVTSITPTNGVRLFNAKSRETYSCTPYCQPSPVLGDSAGHISVNSAAEPQAPAPTAIFDQSAPTNANFSGAMARPLPSNVQSHPQNHFPN